MRLSQAPTTLLSLLPLILSSKHTTNAKPLPFGASELEERQSCTPCGYYGQACCYSNEYCFIDNGQAQWGVTAAGTSQAGSGQGGSWNVYTTTYTQTGLLTVTTTVSNYMAASVVAVTQVPSAISSIYVPACENQNPCGSTCCAAGQFCSNGACADAIGTTQGAGGYVTPTYVLATTVVPTQSAFIRPTSNTVETVTATGTATTTVAFQTAVATDGSSVMGTTVSTNNGLSGGAIAGIVIGVLAAIFLLILFCICCCAKGAIDGVKALLGLGKKKPTRVETEEVYVRHSHHGGSSSRPPQQRTWFGMGPSRPARPEKKSSGWGGASVVAGALAALAVGLGLKRRHDRKDNKTEYSGSSESYSYYTGTSESSESSDRRTRDSRRSRNTRR